MAGVLWHFRLYRFYALFYLIVNLWVLNFGIVKIIANFFDKSMYL